MSELVIFRFLQSAHAKILVKRSYSWFHLGAWSLLSRYWLLKLLHHVLHINGCLPQSSAGHYHNPCQWRGCMRWTRIRHAHFERKVHKFCKTVKNCYANRITGNNDCLKILMRLTPTFLATLQDNCHKFQCSLQEYHSKIDFRNNNMVIGRECQEVNTMSTIKNWLLVSTEILVSISFNQ